jgi:hypothetical protein
LAGGSSKSWSCSMTLEPKDVNSRLYPVPPTGSLAGAPCRKTGRPTPAQQESIEQLSDWPSHALLQHGRAAQLVQGELCKAIAHACSAPLPLRIAHARCGLAACWARDEPRREAPWGLAAKRPTSCFCAAMTPIYCRQGSRQTQATRVRQSARQSVGSVSVEVWWLRMDQTSTRDGSEPIWPHFFAY